MFPCVSLQIETMTADDHLWSCLRKLLETAKKPIILTSHSRSNPEDAVFNLSKLGSSEFVHLDVHEPVGATRQISSELPRTRRRPLGAARLFSSFNPLERNARSSLCRTALVSHSFVLV